MTNENGLSHYLSCAQAYPELRCREHVALGLAIQRLYLLSLVGFTVEKKKMYVDTLISPWRRSTNFRFPSR